jgi:hypothetical protein
MKDYALFAILVLLILLGIAVSSGVFGGMSDLDAFKAAAGLP